MNKQFFFLIVSLFSYAYASNNQPEGPQAKRVCRTPPLCSDPFPVIAAMPTVYIPPLGDEDYLSSDEVDIFSGTDSVHGTSQRPPSVLSDDDPDSLSTREEPTLSDHDGGDSLPACSVRHRGRARYAKPKASEKSDLFSQDCITPPLSNPEGTVLFLRLNCGRSVSYDPEAQRPLKSVSDHRQACKKSNCQGIVFFSIKVNPSRNIITCPFCRNTYSDTKQGYVKHFNEHEPVKRGRDGKLLLLNSDGNYQETSDVVIVVSDN